MDRHREQNALHLLGLVLLWLKKNIDYKTAFELFFIRNCDEFGVLDWQETFVELFVYVPVHFL